jgi:flagellar L-ring protein precursor FlgH
MKSKFSFKPESGFGFKTARCVMLLILAASAASAARAGSLWREGVTDERGMFADKRAKRVGDILTVVVNETVSMTNSVNTTTAKNSSTGLDGVVSNVVNQFLGNLPSSLLGKKAQTAAAPASITIPSLPSLPVSGTSSFTGGGTITNSQTITVRGAVQVVDVLPNGNLVIEGLREISFSKERQFMSLHGIVRPYDIQPDNTIDSTNIAGAQIQVVSEGTLTDAQKKGWLLRLNEKISPY